MLSGNDHQSLLCFFISIDLHQVHGSFFFGKTNRVIFNKWFLAQGIYPFLHHRGCVKFLSRNPGWFFGHAYGQFGRFWGRFYSKITFSRIDGLKIDTVDRFKISTIGADFWIISASGILVVQLNRNVSWFFGPHLKGIPRTYIYRGVLCRYPNGIMVIAVVGYTIQTGTFKLV